MRFTIDNAKQYLVLPYFKGAEEREVKFFGQEGKIVTSLLLEFKEEGNREVYLPSSLFPSKLTIDGPEGLDELVRTEDRAPQSPSHFAYHYTPSFGWINDPNGMYYKDGVYHLYHQYNPVSEKWNNMSWGHAVSSDMVIFKEEKPVFLPKDDKWVIFSGSALDGEFVYTVANVKGDRAFYQERRYSEDGYSFTEPEVIIPNFVGDERDPRLFSYKGEKYILLWLKGNTFALYKKNGDKYEIMNTFDAKDADGGVIQHYAGEFNTDGFVGLEQIELAGLYTQAGRIVCEGEFRIYDLLGRDVTRLNGSLSGVYVVKTANATQKVIVK